MTSLDQTIRGLFQNAALAVPGLPQPPNVAVENVEFSSAVGTPWARFTMVPASSRPYGVNAVTTAHRGLFLVDLYWPPNTGTGPIEAVASAVRKAFRPATRLVSDGVAAVVDYAETSKVMEQKPDWLMCSVSVAWHCFSPLN